MSCRYINNSVDANYDVFSAHAQWLYYNPIKLATKINSVVLLLVTMVRHYLVVFALFCCAVVYGHELRDSMESRLLELENIVKLQGTAIEQQRESLEHQRDVIEHQRELLDQQREELNLYKTDNNALKNQVKHLEDQLILVIETVDDSLDINKTPTEAEVKQPVNGTFDHEDVSLTNKTPDILRSSHKHIRSTKRSSVRQSESSEAFFAYITGTPCLNEHETLVFNHEVTDLGNGYNPGDGIFTVPSTGTYVFTWTTASRGDWYAAALMVNGNAISHTFTDTGNGNFVSQATGIAIINVNQGDHVSVKKVFGQGCDVHDSSYHLTSFAGWRLFGY